MSTDIKKETSPSATASNTNPTSSSTNVTTSPTSSSSTSELSTSKILGLNNSLIATSSVLNAGIKSGPSINNGSSLSNGPITGASAFQRSLSLTRSQSNHNTAQNANGNNNNNNIAARTTSVAGAYTAPSTEWRVGVSIEERQGLRARLKQAYLNNCNSFETLLNTCIALDEELIFANAQNRMEYFKAGIDWDGRVRLKRQQLSGQLGAPGVSTPLKRKEQSGSPTNESTNLLATTTVVPNGDLSLASSTSVTSSSSSSSSSSSTSSSSSSTSSTSSPVKATNSSSSDHPSKKQKS